MAASPSILKLEQQAAKADAIISLLTKQLCQLEGVAAGNRKEVLVQENVQLKAEVAKLTQQLVQLEAAQGQKQFYDFSKGASEAGAPVSAPPAAPKEASPSAADATAPEKKAKKEKPAKKEGSGKKPAEEELPVDVGRLDFRVGRIISAEKHPDAESLYVEKVECGEAEPRTVVSGLVRFVPLEQMQGRAVVLLCNLKPAKMRGVISQAMVMCASTPDKVEILSPPEGSQPGDIVEVDGFARQPDAVLNPKKKIFEACAPDLQTNSDCVAVYRGVPMTVPGKGVVTAATLSGVQVK